jgi:hypothetical protein
VSVDLLVTLAQWDLVVYPVLVVTKAIKVNNLTEAQKAWTLILISGPMGFPGDNGKDGSAGLPGLRGDKG